MKKERKDWDVLIHAKPEQIKHKLVGHYNECHIRNLEYDMHYWTVPTLPTRNVILNSILFHDGKKVFAEGTIDHLDENEGIVFYGLEKVKKYPTVKKPPTRGYTYVERPICSECNKYVTSGCLVKYYRRFICVFCRDNIILKRNPLQFYKMRYHQKKAERDRFPSDSDTWHMLNCHLESIGKKVEKYQT